MNKQCGTSNAERGTAPNRLDARRPLPIRTGVTLIELLITMTIMAIIAAAILGTAAMAIESAREKRTQSLITKIHALIMERYNSYETRRIDVNPTIINAIDQWVTSTVASASNPQQAMKEALKARGEMIADARLLGVRELMKKEMPDRVEDVLYVPKILTQPPPLAFAYDRRRQQLPATAGLSQAECLYLVVMNATGDGEARTLFSKQDIGDVDGDGAPEFIDGWGNPIGWIRWPAGVVSNLQPRNPNGTRPGETDHDPFDLYRRDLPTTKSSLPLTSYPPALQTVYRANMRSRMDRAAGANMTHQQAYRLVPLIYSGGPDGESKLQLTGASSGDDIDPYVANSGAGYADGTQSGAPVADSIELTKDNITNHLIEY
ncbi:prepilin-type N-terminal cleavage/methylation domain-containing protein [Lacipirellula sp.]|uniref:prepilin-type N-terminal cleavage/methylation domain-containing protein n=1 Tax=Lacipirellula sp. TaxID=2691419 RepID=UPI003D1479D8